MGPQSSVKWDTNCVVAATLASAQIILYAQRLLTKSWEPQPSLVREGIFFAVNLAICLAEFRCGVPYYPWIFWMFLGYMLVALPKPYSWAIGAVASLLYVPLQGGWGNFSTLSFPNLFDRIYPLSFPGFWA